LAPDEYAEALAPPLELIPYSGKLLSHRMKFALRGAGKFRGSAKEIEDIFDQLASTAALNRSTDGPSYSLMTLIGRMPPTVSRTLPRLIYTIPPAIIESWCAKRSTPMIQTLFGSLEQKPSFLDRMKEAVTRTRENLAERIEDVVSLGKEIDRSTLDDLEATLLGADLGTTTTREVLEKLRDKADRKQIRNVEELKRLLKEELLAILASANNQSVQRVDGTPEVILVVGVNGTGKTTTIGKLAQVLRSDGKTVLLCAADTFRAAAIEQLEIWGERTGTEVVRTKAGGDPAAVLYDALQAAQARKTDYVIVDTAGRLHTKTNLMAELEKMRRTAQRIIPGAPHETLLVMDATTGQNGLQQARLFTQSAGVTGIVLTKLDGTAKGGVVVAISRELGLPVRYVGVGEKAGDLLPFDPKDFVDSLFA
jgi:fused signal recognition particle receptor